MAGGGGVEDHDPLSSGSYSHLLLSDDESCINFASAAFSSDQNAPKMLCFGPDDQFNKEKCDLFFSEVSTKLAQKTAGVTCSGGVSHPSPATSNAAAAVPTPGKTTHDKKNAAAAGAGRSNPAGKSAPVAAARDNQRSSKKAKVSDDSSETTPRPRHAKAKKEKLGERIIALQQLVSPFGKTDTASVLHEATGYIRFLQGQVQALCSPYLQRLPSPAHLQDHEKEEGAVEGGETRKDLRSKALCLVPADLTAHVAEANGADLWTPATMLYKISANSSR